MENETWWSAPATAESGRLVIVTGRKDIQKYRSNPRFGIRVEVTLPYEGLADGMPDEQTSELLETITESLRAVLRKDPVAVMTGIYTGDNERNWVFYTLSTQIFQKKLNLALADLPLLPLKIYCENDTDWAEYDEMAESEIKMD
ncbi:MAG: DUF695 domain-containing protein [Clostridium sp.]|nr:DUF695 domain-containing protein [Clostridium sp.]